MAEINVITGVVVGQYGEAIQMKVVDKNGNAIDISGYTGTKTLLVRSPDHLKELSWSASFVTDGTNGQFQVTPTSGDIDRPGDWEATLSLASGSAVAKTVPFIIKVDRSM